jgi:hypothetical protein
MSCRRPSIPLPIAIAVGAVVLIFGSFIGREVVLAVGGDAAANEIDRMKDVRAKVRENTGAK